VQVPVLVPVPALVAMPTRRLPRPLPPPWTSAKCLHSQVWTRAVPCGPLWTRVHPWAPPPPCLLPCSRPCECLGTLPLYAAARVCASGIMMHLAVARGVFMCVHMCARMFVHVAMDVFVFLWPACSKCTFFVGLSSPPRYLRSRALLADYTVALLSSVATALPSTSYPLTDEHAIMRRVVRPLLVALGAVTVDPDLCHRLVPPLNRLCSALGKCEAPSSSGDVGTGQCSAEAVCTGPC
jgi:hypothetical protein